ncbi:MAG: type VI secretion system baseplate subunit TssK [Flavobacteriaceae bacterium]|jgi:predicted component of type VI protein secretion system|nr:type VI secretion system baseplate subunit TssK [Flavobacteriaceae bacterium]
MIEKLKHFPVNWIDGMKINKTHFTDVQNFVNDSARDAVGVHTSMIGYGLLPVQDSIKINLVIDNHKLLRIKVEECHAITPNGSRIEIAGESTENINLSIPYPEAVRDLQDNETEVLLACISVNPFKRTPYGEPDTEENPPRYPYTLPEYTLNLIPEKELKNTIGFGMSYLIIGKILVSSGESRIDENYVPPCVNIYSHKKLQELHTEIDHFYGQIELYATQISQKIYAKKQTNALALMMEMMSDKVLNYLGMEIAKFRWLYPHSSPAEMLLSVVAIARVLKNFIDARSGAGKEELLNYVAEWCNISQGDFENIFTDTINVEYNHNQIDSIIVQIRKFMKTLQDLYSVLSRLDYIGKKRDGSIFVSENTDEKDMAIHAKRSRTFLAD